ncbi:MAG: hypothetical protein ACYDEX_21440 [Mobilitalea sp.]
MFITKVLGKIGLTILYPAARIILTPLDQLSGHTTGFFEGIKNIWVEDKTNKECK